MSGLQIVKRDRARVAVAYGYHITDRRELGRRWHVLAVDAQMIPASFDTREQARAYVRDMAPIFAAVNR